MSNTDTLMDEIVTEIKESGVGLVTRKGGEVVVRRGSATVTVTVADTGWNAEVKYADDRENADAETYQGQTPAALNNLLAALVQDPMVLRTLRVDRALWARAKARAEEDGATLSDKVRGFLEEYAGGDDAFVRVEITE